MLRLSQLRNDMKLNNLRPSAEMDRVPRNRISLPWSETNTNQGGLRRVVSEASAVYSFFPASFRSRVRGEIS